MLNPFTPHPSHPKALEKLRRVPERLPRNHLPLFHPFPALPGSSGAARQPHPPKNIPTPQKHPHSRPPPLAEPADPWSRPGAAGGTLPAPCPWWVLRSPPWVAVPRHRPCQAVRARTGGSERESDGALRCAAGTGGGRWHRRRRDVGTRGQAHSVPAGVVRGASAPETSLPGVYGHPDACPEPWGTGQCGLALRGDISPLCTALYPTPRGW